MPENIIKQIQHSTDCWFLTYPDDVIEVTIKVDLFDALFLASLKRKIKTKRQTHNISTICSAYKNVYCGNRQRDRGDRGF